MERQKKRRVIVFIVLLLMILGITIGYAIMSETLTIQGQAEVRPASWEIRFANLSAPAITGDASVPTLPTIGGTGNTTISNYDVILTRPGDSVAFEFDVQNNGSIPARLQTLTMNTPATLTLQGLGATTATADENIVRGNLVYTLTYTDNTPVAQNDTLAAGSSVRMRLTLSYTGTTLPADDVQISGLGVTLLYQQNTP